MTLREYEIDGRTFQYDDSDVPKGAKLVERDKPATKQAKPANKSRTPENKTK